MPKIVQYLSTLGLCVFGIVACGDSATAPLPTNDLGTLYWSLRINHPAVRLSMVKPYDTIQLQAIPYGPDEKPLEEAIGSNDTSPINSSTTWYSTDSARVLVTANGLVQARSVTGNRSVYVVARRRINDKTQEDRALIQVDSNPNPPRIKQLNVHPMDSLKRGAQSLLILTPMILDEADGRITGLPISYRSSNINTARFSNAWSSTMRLGQSRIGPVFITAKTWAYGIAKTDTFTLEVGWPVDASPAPVITPITSAGVRDTPVLIGSVCHIGPGGVVSFNNQSGLNTEAAKPWSAKPRNGEAIDIIFDDPSIALPAGTAYPSFGEGEGNIFGIQGDTSSAYDQRIAYRRFTVIGSHSYTIRPYGFRGTIIVHDK